MSEQTTNAEVVEVAPHGQITQPTPVDLFWERYKKSIIAIGILLLAVFAGLRLLDWLERQKLNGIWGDFTSKVGWSSSFAPVGTGPYDFFRAEGIYKPYREFGDEIRNEDADALTKATGELEPVAASQARVLLASKRAFDGDVDATSKLVTGLEKPWVNKERAWPPVFIKLPEQEEDSDKPKKALSEMKPDEPSAASLDAILKSRAKRAAAFRAKHTALYEAPKPSDKPEIAFETSVGVFKVRLYSKEAPGHAKQFLANCESGWYTKQRFHEIHRKPTDPAQSYQYQGDLAFLGDPGSKQDDRTKWGTFKSEKQTTRERSGISHFPFVLAAHRQDDKVDSDQRVVYFTLTDCAERRDDNYVVFGVVVEGREVIEKIVSGEFNSGTEESAGTGKPANPVQVVKVTVTK